MTDPAVLKRLGALAQDLNEASDVISKQIVALESALNALRLGVWAWVVISRESELTTPDENGKYYELHHMHMLGYGKHKGEWALLVDNYTEEFDEGDSRSVTLLREAKRDVKLEAVEKLPDLLQEIEKKATEMAKNASEKATELSDLAQSLRKQAGVSDEKAGGKAGVRGGK